MSRKPHGINPCDRTYSPKVCQLCISVFTPVTPRQSICAACSEPACADCGTPLPGLRLHRRRDKPDRLCQACFLERRSLPVGSRRLETSGYVKIKSADGIWRYEHRVVMAQIVCRPLLSTEIVHHDNEVKHDNAPGNLILCASLREHLDTYHSRPKLADVG